jgi:hypothetical protein
LARRQSGFFDPSQQEPIASIAGNNHFVADPTWDPPQSGETNRQVRRYSAEGHTPSLQGSLLISLATAGEEAFLFIPAA